MPPQEEQKPEVPQAPYRLEPMSKEEGQTLTDALQEVLKKFDAELGVVSNIQLLKRVKVEPKAEPVESPKEFYAGDDNTGGQGAKETAPQA